MSTRKLRNLGPLHDLLLRACPPNEQGIQSIPLLADAVGCTPATIYRWISIDKLPADRAVSVVEVSGGAVALEDLHPYVFQS